jgi:hypothetical protein
MLSEQLIANSSCQVTGFDKSALWFAAWDDRDTPLSLIADTLSWGAQVYLDGKVSDEFAQQREIFFHCTYALSPNKTANIHHMLPTSIHLPHISLSDTIVLL